LLHSLPVNLEEKTEGIVRSDSDIFNDPYCYAYLSSVNLTWDDRTKILTNRVGLGFAFGAQPLPGDKRSAWLIEIINDGDWGVFCGVIGTNEYLDARADLHETTTGFQSDGGWAISGKWCPAHRNWRRLCIGDIYTLVYDPVAGTLTATIDRENMSCTLNFEPMECAFLYASLGIGDGSVRVVHLPLE